MLSVPVSMLGLELELGPVPMLGPMLGQVHPQTRWPSQAIRLTSQER